MNGEKVTLLWIVGYFVIVNIIAFAMMGIDKSRAKKHAWRISEAALFFSALIGGSLGSVLGMQTFRHKTKHWYFKWGMPFILIVQISLAVFVLKYFNITIM